MCYGIKDFVGKKTREEKVVRIPRVSPERIGSSKVNAMVRAWLKKLGHKRATREKEKQPEWV